MFGFPFKAGPYALALAGSLVMLAPQARAESFFFSLFQPSPDRIVVQLQRSGYEMRSALMRRGDVYICDVVDPDGRRERLVIDSRDGRVLERFLSRGPTYAMAPRHSHDWADRPDSDWGDETAPPRPLVNLPRVPSPDEERDPGRAQREARGEFPNFSTTPPDAPMIEHPKPKPKPHVVRPKAAPAPQPSTAAVPNGEAPATTGAESATPAPAPSTAAVSPTDTEAPSAPAAAPSSAPTLVSPAPEAPRAAPATPVAEVKPTPPASPAKPVETKPKKAINDLPVNPLN